MGQLHAVCVIKQPDGQEVEARVGSIDGETGDDIAVIFEMLIDDVHGEVVLVEDGLYGC